MRSRLQASTRRKLERLEQSFAIGRPIALWPPILSCEDWEAIAFPMQQQLSTDSIQGENTIHLKFKQ
jgi:hypothetical protein